MALMQRQPPIWLYLGLPLFMLLWTIYMYQEQVVTTGTEVATGVVQTFSSTFSGGSTPDATIIRDGDHDEYLAVCLYVRDQAQDLPEFFQHHYYQMGIRRFYVMDDGSDPPMSHYMDKYGIPEEAVDFVWSAIATTTPQGTQLEKNNECNNVYGVNNTWIAYIDADEFFDTPGDESLEDILRDFETSRPEVGALGVNWAMHTSSHQLHHVESVRQTYLECISDDLENNSENSDARHIKSIVRTDAYERPENPHKFNLKPGFVTVGEYGDTVDSYAFRQPITRDRIGLHHYVLKSFEDYADKITRSAKGWQFWNRLEYDTPHQACAEMLKYFPKTVNKDGAW